MLNWLVFSNQKRIKLALQRYCSCKSIM